MRKHVLYLLAVLLLASSAQAATLFTDSFETSTEGGNPVGWTVLSNGSATLAVSSLQQYDGSLSVFMQGGSYSNAAISKDLTSFPIDPGGTYNLTYYAYLDSSQFPKPDPSESSWGYGISGGLYLSGQYTNIVVNNDLNVIIGQLTQPYPQMVGFPATTDAWVKYEIEMNLLSNSADYFINGIGVGSMALDNTNYYPFTSGDNQILLVTGGARYNTSTAYFDQVTFRSAEPVPEPVTMLLLGSGLAGLAAFRSKFRKG